MNHYHQFHRLADAYPAESTWTIGPSEPLEWWEISLGALQIAQDAPGCDPTGSGGEQVRYWREAYRELEGAVGVMVSVEVIEFAEI